MPSPYDNRIHGHIYYGDPMPGEGEAECEARTRVWCAVSCAPYAMKEQMWQALNATAPAVKSEAAPAAFATIYYHGERGYSIDGRTPVVISYGAHAILQIFLQKQTAMTRAELEEASGYCNAPIIIGRLQRSNCGRFRPAVARPGTKSNGGYFIRVQSVP
jgi:hypothetical protein